MRACKMLRSRPGFERALSHGLLIDNRNEDRPRRRPAEGGSKNDRSSASSWPAVAVHTFLSGAARFPATWNVRFARRRPQGGTAAHWPARLTPLTESDKI